MVFWQTYPLGSFFRPSVFTLRVPFDKPRLPVPPGIRCVILTSTTATRAVLQSIQTYLRVYFGNPPHTPVLDMPESDLLGPRDIIMALYQEDMMVGTVRYHAMGEFIVSPSDKETIYCVDCFCIHPAWRKKGLGDFLLTELHSYANAHGIPYAIFLKEGAPVSALHLPFYSSTYVYCEVSRLTAISSRVHCLSMNKAHRLLDQWHSVQSHLFIIRHRGVNQHWRLYKRGIYYVLACIQDTFQRKDSRPMGKDSHPMGKDSRPMGKDSHPMGKDSRPMGWVTAWLESPFIHDALRAEAAEQIAATSPFPYLWMNRKWIGDSTQWTPDGSFHWYMHQWTTDKTLDRSYCLMV